MTPLSLVHSRKDTIILVNAQVRVLLANEIIEIAVYNFNWRLSILLKEPL